MKETDLYPPVKQWLEEQGYEVYPEIPIGSSGAVADVVGVREDDDGAPIIVIVELKTSLSLALMEQCHKWRKRAHLIYAAVPALQRRQWPRPGLRYLRMDGTGLLEIEERYNFDTKETYLKAQKTESAKWEDDVSLAWLSDLTDLHKTWTVGGTGKGGYLSQYRLTMLGIREYLEARSPEWVAVKQIAKECPHHYQSRYPYNSIARALGFIEDWAETKLVEDELCARVKPEGGAA